MFAAGMLHRSLHRCVLRVDRMPADADQVPDALVEPLDDTGLTAKLHGDNVLPEARALIGAPLCPQLPDTHA